MPVPDGTFLAALLEPALIPRWGFYAIPWLAAVLIATANAGRLGGRRAVGLGLMTVPVWDTLLGIIESFGPLLQGGVILRAYTTYELSYLYSYKFLSDLGYLGVGFLLYAPGPLLSRTPQMLARQLAATGFPMGRRSEGASAAIGFVAFPVLLLGTVGVNIFLSGFQSLNQSDESSVFENMTVYHAVLISLAAAFGEELVYRGLVQTALVRGATRAAGGASASRAARGVAIAAAILLQAVFFGFAHSGYATWIHVLLPTLFGVVAGIAAWRFGIWSAIVLHAMVDIYAFGAEASARHDWLWPALGLLFLANLGLTLGWSIARLARKVQAAPAQPA